MRRVRLAMPVAAVLLTFGGLATVANAATPEECQAQIDALTLQTTSADLFGQNADKERANLTARLDAATLKLAEGKVIDAGDKLVGFRSSVELLSSATKPKIDPVDASALIAGANDAITCVSDLQAAP